MPEIPLSLGFYRSTNPRSFEIIHTQTGKKRLKPEILALLNRKKGCRNLCHKKIVIAVPNRILFSRLKRRKEDNGFSKHLNIMLDISHSEKENLVQDQTALWHIRIADHASRKSKERQQNNIFSVLLWERCK